MLVWIAVGLLHPEMVMFDVVTMRCSALAYWNSEVVLNTLSPCSVIIIFTVCSWPFRCRNLSSLSAAIYARVVLCRFNTSHRGFTHVMSAAMIDRARSRFLCGAPQHRQNVQTRCVRLLDSANTGLSAFGLGFWYLGLGYVAIIQCLVIICVTIPRFPPKILCREVK